VRPRTWLCALATAALLAGSGSAMARDHGHGHDQGDDNGQGWHGHHGNHDDDDGDWHHGRGREHEDYGRDDDHGRYYRGHDQDEIRAWYRGHYRDLPPGLARRDRLPPGLERQLVVRGTLPPGLRRRMEPCPRELERELPPPPPHCEHVIIGGHLVLLNRENFRIVDVFHFEF
jgi:hypothetical protein